MKRALSVMMLTVAACSGDSEPRSEGAQLDAGELGPDGASGDAGSRLDARAPVTPDASQQDAGDAWNHGDGGDAAVPTDAAGSCALGTPQLDVARVSVKKRGGGTPSKGAELELEVELTNTGGGAMVTITPELTSMRFSDYRDVPLGSETTLACPGTTRVVITGGPFLSKGKKHYALGSGRYTVSGVGLDDAHDDSFDGASFEIAKSNALLVPVVYDARYLEGIKDNPFDTPEAFLEASFQRANEIFTPSGNDPDGAGSYKSFPKGFDQMMDVEHHFKAFAGFPGESTTDQGWCEDATAYASDALGLATAWSSQPAETRPERHGFDYLIALTPDMGGGVACGWLDVQVSSYINRDVDRQQIIAVHETGHLFGAPHCDDVGNGSGGSLQGYVMCSGEKHPHYPDAFVWHQTSIDKMKSHWD